MKLLHGDNVRDWRSFREIGQRSTRQFVGSIESVVNPFDMVVAWPRGVTRRWKIIQRVEGIMLLDDGTDNDETTMGDVVADGLIDAADIA